MKKILVLLAVVSFSLLWASCAGPKGLKYQDIENLNVLKDQKYPFVVYVRLYNPNKFPLDVKYYDFDTYLEDHSLGSINTDTLISVGGKETILLPLRYNPNYRDMFLDPEKSLSRPNLNVKINGSLAIERKHRFYITHIRFDGDLPQAQ